MASTTSGLDFPKSKKRMVSSDPPIIFRPNGNVECNHKCADKSACGHLCCKVGLKKKRAVKAALPVKRKRKDGSLTRSKLLSDSSGDDDEDVLTDITNKPNLKKLYHYDSVVTTNKNMAISLISKHNNSNYNNCSKENLGVGESGNMGELLDGAKTNQHLLLDEKALKLYDDGICGYSDFDDNNDDDDADLLNPISSLGRRQLKSPSVVVTKKLKTPKRGK